MNSSIYKDLTARELEVLRLLAAGHRNRAIAESLEVTISTVESHVHRILHKLGVASRVQAALWFARDSPLTYPNHDNLI
jgi:DNA-binding NarL/FixJ family response regulator